MRSILYYYLGYLEGVAFNACKYRKYLLKLFKGDRKPMLQYAENLLKHHQHGAGAPGGFWSVLVVSNKDSQIS